MYSPSYSITTKMLRLIGVIEACKQSIDHAPLLPYYEKKFRDDAVLRAAHHGTHLEGNELNLSQAQRVLEGEQVVGRERDVQEVINYRKVMEFINLLHVGSQKEKVDEGLVCRLHSFIVDRVLSSEKKGQLRSTQVVIRNSFTGEVSFKPPAAPAVSGHLKELFAYINTTTEEDINPLLKSGIVHYEFVRIHPFVDGNGRVGRCLSTLILYQEDYDIRKFFSLEEYFDKHAAEYYEALQSVSKNNGDQTQWLEFFLEGLAVELTKVKEKVERISIDGRIKEKLGGKPLLLTERQLKIIEYLQETGHLQNNAFKQLFPFVSEDTVLNELKSLIESGIVKKVGKTKAAKYVMA